MTSLSRPTPVAFSPMWLNLFIGSVPAGYPSPITEQAKELVDINGYLIRNEIATNIFRVQGNAMIDAGIFDGDVLIVDRSIEPKHKDIIMVTLRTNSLLSDSSNELES